MNPFKSWPVFAATVWTTVLFSPGWWGEWWTYFPGWIVAASWFLAGWFYLPEAAGPQKTKWMLWLLASYGVLGSALWSTGASPAGVFWSASSVTLAYCALRTRHLWRAK